MNISADSLKKATELYHAGRMEDATVVLRRLLKQEPDNGDAHHLLGVIAHREGRHDQAVRWIEQAIILQPESPIFFNSLGLVRATLRQFDQAQVAFGQALRLKPDFAEARNNLGNLLSDHGQSEAARDQYRQALRLDPRSPAAHNNLADVLRELGDLDTACDHAREALRLRSDFLEARYTLGNIMREMGLLADAEEQFRQVLRMRPDFLPARLNLGNVLKEQNQVEEAIAEYKRILTIRPNHVDACFNLGNALYAAGRIDEAITHFQRVMVLQPHHIHASNNLRNACTRLVPPWHFPMMNDQSRNEAYERAVQNAMKPNALVLEIGTGSGLLAMMAARAGAHRVVTTEIVSLLAQKAREIIQLNGLEEIVTVLDKKSTMLRVGVDMPERADILVTEIFDVGLLGEQAIATIQHARANLLKADATILPCRAVIHAALLESQTLWQEGFVGKVAGFDLSPFNAFHRNHLQKRLAEFPHRLLSGTFEVFTFDFCGEPIRDDCRELLVRVASDGECHGVVSWFRLYLDEETAIETAPTREYSHWMQAIQLWEQPIAVKTGDMLSLTARHNRQLVTVVPSSLSDLSNQPLGKNDHGD